MFKQTRMKIKYYLLTLVILLSLTACGSEIENDEVESSISEIVESSVEEIIEPTVEEETSTIELETTIEETTTQEETTEEITTEENTTVEETSIVATTEELPTEEAVVVSSLETTFKITDIPAYKNKVYSVVNENVPYFSADEMDQALNSYEEYSNLDSKGRCGTCIASVGKDIMPTEERGPIGDVKPTGWKQNKYPGVVDGNYLYNRCHLIGFQLTGENANTKNLITGTRYFNVEGMLPFENMVADYVKETGNHVLYRVTPIFKENNLLADGVLMEAKSVEDDGEGILFCVFCYNVQPGIKIDYSNGQNELEKKEEPKEKYTYKNLSSTMYVKKSVNVRDLPSTDGKRVGGLTAAEKVIITGQCIQTGWYRIKFKGGECYVSNSYITKDKPAPKPAPAPKPESKPKPAPAPQPEPKPAPEPEPAIAPKSTYILNTNTKKFHNPNCSSVGQMAEHNKAVYEGSRDDIINQGYKPCKRCNP